MSDDDWLEAEPWPHLLDDLIADVVARYRISWTQAERIIRDSLAAKLQLRQVAVDNSSAAKVKRTRAFKEAASEAKRNVYYHLRTYRAEQDHLLELIANLRQVTPDTSLEQREQAVAAIVASHASSRERLAQRDEFYQRMFAAVTPPRQVVDIGCGVHPLMFPFDAPWSHDIARYCALDSNPHDIASIEAFANTRPDLGKVVPLLWNLADGWDAVLACVGRTSFDLALMMKVVPVVERQHRELIPVLCATPATTWLITGSRVSLTKHVSIERREKRVLEEFVNRAGRVVEREFVVGEEFAWVVTKPTSEA